MASAYGQSLKWLFITSGGCIVASAATYWKTEASTYRKTEAPKKVSAFTSQPFKPWDSNWDKRDISSVLKPYNTKGDPERLKKLEKKKESLIPTARRHIFLIRHGQYRTNEKKEHGRRLTELGKEQSDIVGKRLKALDLNYTRLIRSTMVRAMQTAAEIQKYFPGIPVEDSNLIIEGDPIPSEPPAGGWKEEYRYHKDGPRIEAAFRTYFHRASPDQKNDSFEIMVCHANVIRYFICRLLQAPPEAWLRFSIHHCSITIATIEPDGNVYLTAIGDSSFMPVDKLTRV